MEAPGSKISRLGRRKYSKMPSRLRKIPEGVKEPKSLTLLSSPRQRIKTVQRRTKASQSFRVCEGDAGAGSETSQRGGGFA